MMFGSLKTVIQDFLIVCSSKWMKQQRFKTTTVALKISPSTVWHWTLGIPYCLEKKLYKGNWENTHPNGISYVISPYLGGEYLCWMLLGGRGRGKKKEERRKKQERRRKKKEARKKKERRKKEERREGSRKFH